MPMHEDIRNRLAELESENDILKNKLEATEERLKSKEEQLNGYMNMLKSREDIIDKLDDELVGKDLLMEQIDILQKAHEDDTKLIHYLIQEFL